MYIFWNSLYPFQVTEYIINYVLIFFIESESEVA